MDGLDLGKSPPELLITVHRQDGLHVVTLTGEADLATEHRLFPALGEAVSGADAVVLDLSRLRFCSVFSVETLADLMTSAARRGVRVAVVGLSRVTTLVWLRTRLPVPQQFATLSGAVAELSRAPTTSAAPRRLGGPFRVEPGVRVRARASSVVHEEPLPREGAGRAALPPVAVHEFAGMPHSQQPLSASLDQLASALLRAVPDARYVTVSTTKASDRPALAVTEGMRWLLDERSRGASSGPCTDAAATGRTVVLNCPAPTEATGDVNPELATQAGWHGIRQVLAVPLHAGGGCVGAMGFYFTELPLSQSTLRQVQELAAHAAVVVLDATTHAAAQETDVQLATAMRSRAVIEQAKGVIMARYGCSAEQAFAVLAQRSQNAHRTVRDVADDVVATSSGGPPFSPMKGHVGDEPNAMSVTPITSE